MISPVLMLSLCSLSCYIVQFIDSCDDENRQLIQTEMGRTHHFHLAFVAVGQYEMNVALIDEESPIKRNIPKWSKITGKPMFLMLEQTVADHVPLSESKRAISRHHHVIAEDSIDEDASECDQNNSIVTRHLIDPSEELEDHRQAPGHNVSRVVVKSTKMAHSSLQVSRGRCHAGEVENLICKTLENQPSCYNIPVYLVAELVENRYVIVMEYSHSTLDDFLKSHRGCLDVTTAAEIITQLALTVKNLHERGIFHRDLTPCNVLMMRLPGRQVPLVKLCDFGMSAIISVHSEYFHDSAQFHDTLEEFNQELQTDDGKEDFNGREASHPGTDLDKFFEVVDEILPFVPKYEELKAILERGENFLTEEEFSMRFNHSELYSLVSLKSFILRTNTTEKNFSTVLQKLKESTSWRLFDNRRFMSPWLDWWMNDQ
eukprot:TRINITY_DN50400_c0_g1_i1.p1 TRINITY_DN50400_c0_g1~~TRINITY_DN50400_c0_g1_i1.p1  ORF type:complete len:430 (+),score=97.51 TRINITY_DN50400_c0_g1_i1:305-1594(+)